MTELEQLANALRSAGYAISPAALGGILVDLGLTLSGGGRARAEAHLGRHKELAGKGAIIQDERQTDLEAQTARLSHAETATESGHAEMVWLEGVARGIS